MRTIRFRGKDENGKWHFGHLINDGKKSYIIDGIVECNDEYITIERWQQVIPETVGQYTGRRDCHGVEIYDGDIVADVIGDKFTVEWNDDTFRWQLSNGESLNDGDTYGIMIDVVGNIHELERTFK